MYDYVFNEEEMKKRKKNKKKKTREKALQFFLITKLEQDVDSRICLLPSAINKNKKHNQLYLDEESQRIFHNYG